MNSTDLPPDSHFLHQGDDHAPPSQSGFFYQERLLPTTTDTADESMENEFPITAKALVGQPRKKAQRITEYIKDRQLRYKSYIRRRTVPFKRLREVDTFCNSESFMLQVSNDFGETLYSGFSHQLILDQFYSEEGLSITNVFQLVQKLKKSFKKSTSLKSESHNNDVSTTGSPLTTIDKSKAFRSRRDSLISKIHETDSVLGVQSFILIVNPEKDTAFYHGDPKLVSKFFSFGISVTNMDINLNVRAYHIDEGHFNICSVPHCIVTRNTLSRWKRAAVELYKFPPHLPLTLHPCPEDQRQNWIAELDLDPNMTGKLSVCSLHFKEGRPTEKYPYPTELLRKNDGSICFPGRNGQEEKDGKDEKLGGENEQNEIQERTKFLQFVLRKRPKKTTLSRFSKRTPANKDQIQQKQPLSVISSNKIVKRVLMNKLRSRIRCSKCRYYFSGFREFYSHFLKNHRASAVDSMEKPKPEKNVPEDEDNKLFIDEMGKSPSLAVKPAEFEEVTYTPEEERNCLMTLYPKDGSRSMNPRKKYVCAVCKSVCDLFGLFLHMKQVHQGILCQYCLKLFKKVSDLEIHLRNAHYVRPKYFHSTQQFADVAGSSYDFMCSICSKIVRFKDIESHPCSKAVRRIFDCPFCNRTFTYQSQLELHICNGWCKGMTWLSKPSSKETAKLYKVLTGIDLVKDYDNQLDKNRSKNSVKADEQKKKTESEKLQFDVSDKSILAKYSKADSTEGKLSEDNVKMLEGLPTEGSIICGEASRGMNNYVKKDLKESGYKFDLSAKLKDVNLTPTEKIESLEITKAGKNFIIHSCPSSTVMEDVSNGAKTLEKSENKCEMQSGKVPNLKIRTNFSMETKGSPQRKSIEAKPPPLVLKVPVGKQKKESKKEKRERIANEIVTNLGRVKEAVDCFKTKCLFCEQTRYICVESTFLLSHLSIIHDESEVFKILKEDPEKCVDRIKKHLKDVKVRDSIFNYSYDQEFKFSGYRCCYCSTYHNPSDYSDLFKHLAEAHKSKVLKCHLCQNIFLNYGSYLSHICFGPATSGQVARAKFGCKVCGKQDLGNFLDFQFHLRKVHNLCEICLKKQDSQEDLYTHCQTHSQELMCMKCFLTYEDRLEFRKHLYYKHEDEHKVCKICHQKTWPHVYHFCIQPDDLVCEVCGMHFDNLRPYRVHMRTHTGANPYLCSAQNCQKAFVSRQLLWKHQIRRHPDIRAAAFKCLEEKRTKRKMARFGATSLEHIKLCEDIVNDIVKCCVPEEKTTEEEDDESNVHLTDSGDQKSGQEQKAEEYDPIDAAVRSIMGPEGSFTSPTKMPPLSPLRPQIPSIPSSKPVVSANLSREFSDLSSQSMNSGIEHEGSKILEAGAESLLRDSVATKFGSMAFSAPGVNVIRPRLFANNQSNMAPSPHKGAKVRLPSRPGHFGQGPKIHTPVIPLSNATNNQDKAETLDKCDKSDVKRSNDSSTESDENASTTKISSIWNQELLMIAGEKEKVPTPEHPIPAQPKRTAENKGLKTLNPKLAAWDVDLSESSGDEETLDRPKKARIMAREPVDPQQSLKDHDYCLAAYIYATMPPPKPKEDLAEMDKIASNVALGATADNVDEQNVSAEDASISKKKSKKKKKKKKNKKNKKKRNQSDPGSSSESEAEIDVGSPISTSTPASRLSRRLGSGGPRPKYHTSANTGVTAANARPWFSSSEDEEDQAKRSDSSNAEPESSDLDTDFEADDLLANLKQIQNKSRRIKPSAKALESSEASKASSRKEEEKKPSLKLTIKLPKPPGSVPPTPVPATPPVFTPKPTPKARMINTSLPQSKKKSNRKPAAKSRKRPAKPLSLPRAPKVIASTPGSNLSKKMQESLALTKAAASISSDSSDMSGVSDNEQSNLVIDSGQYALAAAPPQPPVMDTRLYCICQSPYDDVSQMIGCDAPDCKQEWFHFECVGIIIPPSGKWYCPECSKRYKMNN